MGRKNLVRLGILLILVAGFVPTWHQTNWSRSTTALEDNYLPAAPLASSPTIYNNDQDGMVHVFYNLFVGSESDLPRIERLVAQQLEELQPEHKVFDNSIGIPLQTFPLNVKLLQHHAQESELITLHSLWEYCNVNPSAKVVHLHSKGSFHPTPEDDKLRAFLTTGALSRECLNLPNACNVCSSRMSPVRSSPSHTWQHVARYSYIQRLIEPSYLWVAWLVYTR
jgi:hypothetical protein